MFTGIITTRGKFVSLKKSGNPILTIDTVFESPVNPGDSVAVNGACLTLLENKNNKYTFNVSGETLSKTNLFDLKKSEILNLELPVTLSTMLSGHLVSGHIDGTARVRRIEKSRGSVRFSFTFTNREWKKFLINKGSVCVNGVSLTISEISSSFFSVEVIPMTLEETNLKFLGIGYRVNIELDLIAKYIYNFGFNRSDPLRLID